MAFETYTVPPSQILSTYKSLDAIGEEGVRRSEALETDFQITNEKYEKLVRKEFTTVNYVEARQRALDELYQRADEEEEEIFYWYVETIAPLLGRTTLRCRHQAAGYYIAEFPEEDRDDARERVTWYNHGLAYIEHQVDITAQTFAFKFIFKSFQPKTEEPVSEAPSAEVVTSLPVFTGARRTDASTDRYLINPSNPRAIDATSMAIPGSFGEATRKDRVIARYPVERLDFDEQRGECIIYYKKRKPIRFKPNPHAYRISTEQLDRDSPDYVGPIYVKDEKDEYHILEEPKADQFVELYIPAGVRSVESIMHRNDDYDEEPTDIQRVAQQSTGARSSSFFSFRERGR